MLITDVPGVFSDPAPQLHATQGHSENKNSRENAKEKRARPDRNEGMAEE